MFRRPLLLIILVLLGALLVGLLALSAFPPGVAPSPVERVLPNDRFQVR
jgi:hypothetical protein